MTEIRKYGWKPDVKDPVRDFKYQPSGKKLPPNVDLRPKMPKVENQGQLGSCTSFGIAGAIEYNFNVMNHPFFTPSHLFIYYNERVLEGTVKSDSGASISDGIKTVAKQGVCPETLWAYNINKFASKPPKKCYTQAKKDVVTKYERVTGLEQLKDAIASGYPVVFGMSVYESFESDAVAQTGIVPMPNANEQFLGGHCVLASGYDDATGRVLVRNSWGESWGIKGYCEMPYDYFNNELVSDCWVIYYAL
jgi:C1A family cysteine protease